MRTIQVIDLNELEDKQEQIKRELWLSVIMVVLAGVLFIMGLVWINMEINTIISNNPAQPYTLRGK